MRRRAAILAAAGLATTAHAAEINLPAGATLNGEDIAPYSSVGLPWGPFPDDGILPTIDAEGAVTRRAYEVGPTSLTSLQLLAPLRDQLAEDGFAELYSCESAACGGYDFRFALDLLAPPAMYVDLGDYRYYLGVRDSDEGREHVAIVASRGGASGFIHITTVGPASADLVIPDVAVEEAPAAVLSEPAMTSDFDEHLLKSGHAVLAGLDFPSGSSSLAQDDYPVLRTLAAFLAKNPTARVTLVGHTDSVGGLDANTRLSKARAQSVRTRLIGAYDADPDRILAEGAGFLAPRASNLTPEGRAANRRVEVVLLSLE